MPDLIKTPELIRDEYAGQAMQAIIKLQHSAPFSPRGVYLQGKNQYSHEYEILARISFDLADKMAIEREKRKRVKELLDENKKET